MKGEVQRSLMVGGLGAGGCFFLNAIFGLTGSPKFLGMMEFCIFCETLVDFFVLGLAQTF